MQWVDFLRWAHALGATLLFGTGLGIAFFMYRAHSTENPSLIAHVAGTVVIADSIFTATAVVLQPITGFALVRSVGWPLTEGWILLSLLLYVLAGLFWLPVLWLQLRLRDLAQSAARAGERLPEIHRRLFRLWFACGWPAIIGVLLILWLMVNKPSFAIL